MNSETAFSLTCTVGPSAGQVFELDQATLTIGRDAVSDIVIEGEGVSRMHAQLIRDGNTYLVRDLTSSNGTFVNGQRISALQLLAAGDRIRLGQSVELRFAVPARSAAEPTTLEPDAPRASAPAARAAPAVAETMLGGIFDIDAVQTPPELIVEAAGQGSRNYPLTAERYTIGRAEDNDITIGSKIVSRYHFHLERTSSGYRLVELPDASNPLYLEGRRLAGARELQHGDMLRIGGRDPGLMVTFRYSSPATAQAQPEAVEIRFGERTLLQIGRDPTNDIRLDVPQVSRFHAQVERVGKRYRMQDLRSTNGTFVNDERIESAVWLQPSATVRIGPYRFVLGEDRLAQYDDSMGLRVDAVDLSKWVRKDLNILQDISLVLQPREFVVVVGQSGGGKSTLVDAIAGYRPATHGTVLVNGIDVYRNFDAVRNDIGFVPQRDIIHMELTVYQALDYAAQLRMPADTSKRERHTRIMEVLEDLDLVHRKDVQISGLSGGQQKRVSIGVELLTKPGLFFLDEPTSGLDPGTETALMQLMRRLADQGRTIVLITHATKNVMLADKVVFLARGGYVGWFGPPDECLRYFDQYRSERERRIGDMEFDQIYAVLDDPDKGTPATWNARYREQPAYEQYVAEPLRSRQQPPGRPSAGLSALQAAAPAGRRRRQASSLRQFLILSARNFTILTRDRFSLLLMLAAAPLVGLLDFVVAALLGGPNPFDPGAGNIANVIMTLFLLSLYAIMVAALAQMREIVKEQGLYRRERLVNLKVIPYVMSKVWVAALVALYHAAAYVIIRYLAFEMPGGAIEFVLIYITMVLATMAGMMLGLFASALAPNSNSAPMIVILLILPQIVLGGALIPLPGPGQVVSALTLSRWPFETMMAITGVGSEVVADACWQLPKAQRDELSLEYRSAICPCMGVNLFRPERCTFPGVLQNYDPAVDATLPDEPTEPVIPPKPTLVLPPPPTEPPDQRDTVAVAEYLEELQVWQAAVDQMRADFEGEIAAYEAEVGLIQAQFEADLGAYAEERQTIEVGRNAAVLKAEGLVAKILDEFGWSFVNKDDLTAYAYKVATRWGALVGISFLLFVGILILQKRKDVVR